MKSKLTTTFALLGVLAAGTAAAAVNTQALQSRAESTIGAGTTTLIAPVTGTPVAGDPATQTIQLDANVATAPATTPASSTGSSAPTKKASASPSVNSAGTATVATATSQPEFNGDDNAGDDGDDD